MSLDLQALTELAQVLAAHPAVHEKAIIAGAYAPAIPLSGEVTLGDDCAAIPDPASGGHLLFAAEGMLQPFIEEDPWFAGYCAVMVNLSDVAAMGGRPIAITDVLWTSDEALYKNVWEGMTAASEAYGVPIVGGHTSRGTPGLAAAVIGRAGKSLITSFDAKPGDQLVMVIDMAGNYRDDKPFWNASTTTPSDRLRSDLELMATLSENHLCRAGKDISNGGVIGTLAMLSHCSEVGVIVDLDAMPIPENTTWEKWLTSFPSYGYLLAVSENQLGAVMSHFESSEITCAAVGIFEKDRSIFLESGSEKIVIAL